MEETRKNHPWGANTKQRAKKGTLSKRAKGYN